jgi:hypothetical protein
MPYHSKISLGTQQRKEICADSQKQRDQIVRELDLLLESYGPFTTFTDLFRKVVDDLDTQYLQIRKARKELVDYNVSGPKCDIDLEKARCDEMIDWDAEAPRITVPEKPDIDDED